MPTEERVLAAAQELAKKLQRIGYDTKEIVGPEEHPDSEKESEDEKSYFITAETPDSIFFITLSTEQEYASIVYPYNIARHIARSLSPDEVEDILDVEQEWDNIDDGTIENLFEEAGISIIENTPRESLYGPRFSISAYASSSIVDYSGTFAENEFPIGYKSHCSIFPYSENVTIQQLDYRTHPVIISGKRAQRYVESSLYVDRGSDPTDYVLEARF